MNSEPEKTPHNQSSLQICLYPDPVLRQECAAVESGEVLINLKDTFQGMIESMYQASGLGLAAPQVGITSRFFVMDSSQERNQPQVIINPKITSSSGRIREEEGCLSMPGICGKVTRSRKISVSYLDKNGNACEGEMEELAAKIFQHELDHLNGVLFIDRLSTAKRLSIRDQLASMVRDFEEQV